MLSASGAASTPARAAHRRGGGEAARADGAGREPLAVLERVDQEQVLGFYDDRAQRLAVIRDADAGRPLLELTLAHELVHALEDQRYGFDMPEGCARTTCWPRRPWRRASATAVMADYAERTSGGGRAVGRRGRRRRGVPGTSSASSSSPTSRGRSSCRSCAASRAAGTPSTPSTGCGAPGPRAGDPSAQVRGGRGCGPRPAALPARRAARAVAAPALCERGRVRPADALQAEPRVAPGARGRGWGGGRFELWRRPAPGATRPACGPILRGSGCAGTPDRPRRGRGGAADGGRARWRNRGGAVALVGTGVRTTVALAPDARTARAAVAAGAAGVTGTGSRIVWHHRSGAPVGRSPQGRSTIGEKRAGRPGRAAPACLRGYPGRGGRGKKALVRRAYSAYPGRRACMCRSSSVTPDTRRSRTDMTSGPAIAHHASPVASATAYRPHHAEVAEVVGVACVAPQATVHDPALVGGIGLEARELHVAHGLEEHAHAPQRDPDEVQRHQPGRLRLAPGPPARAARRPTSARPGVRTPDRGSPVRALWRLRMAR